VARGIGFVLCFHQLISQRFSGEHLRSFLARTEDWTDQGEYSSGANLEDMKDMILGHRVCGPEPVFVDLLRRPGIDSQPGGPVRNPICRAGPSVHRLAKSIPRNGFLSSINVYKYGLWECLNSKDENAMSESTLSEIALCKRRKALWVSVSVYVLSLVSWLRAYEFRKESHIKRRSKEDISFIQSQTLHSCKAYGSMNGISPVAVR
jgi:hypothetical protein